MKILINHGHLTTELTSTPNETWGQFTQRFVEHSLLHPPQLLQLLVDISNYSNKSGGVSSGCSYRLRYGDGYGTLIKPTWNATSSVEVGEDDGNNIIEANITLKPKSGSPLADASSSNFSGLVIDESVSSNMKQIEVDLFVEKIGLSSSKDGKQKKKKKKKSTATTEGGGSILFGDMTQTPFPINVKRVHVLNVVEHSLFKGVIDSYSLSKPGGEEDSSTGGVGGTTSTSLSGKKRKEKPAAAATETSSGGAKKGRNEETTSDAKSTSVTKKGGSEKATPDAKSTPVTANSILQKAHDLAASMQKKDTQGASSSSSSNKKQTIVNGGGEKVGNDNTDDSALKKNKKSASPKKTTADDAATEQSPKKSTAATDKSSEKKKKKKSPKKKKADDVVGEEVDATTDKPPAKKKARKSTGGDDDDKEKEGKEPATPIPKRPLNAYQRFANDIRPKVTKDNPDIKFGEVVSVYYYD